jgi:hypothetical protein
MNQAPRTKDYIVQILSCSDALPFVCQTPDRLELRTALPPSVCIEFFHASINPGEFCSSFLPPELCFYVWQAVVQYILSSLQLHLGLYMIEDFCHSLLGDAVR